MLNTSQMIWDELQENEIIYENSFEIYDFESAKL